MAPSELSRAITDEQWPRAVEIARRFPKQAQQWSKRQGFFEGRTVANVLPLHEAVVGQAPYDCVVAIVQAWTGALTQLESSYQRLPLHCACRKNADPRVVNFLVQQNKDSGLVPDSLGRLPIHYALSNGADPAVISVLMQANPRAARGMDLRGWMPLHVACSMGASQGVVKSLLDAYPEAVLIKTKKGSTVTRCIPKQCPHRQDLKDLINEAREKVEGNVALPSLQRKSLEFDEHMVLV
mmetsp:Transcript_18287/g.39567  ORF Transcript_18287/g.39567 Transcript_18287/m.39567 type:complete len:239 (-) Transcript_18287:328-1044(-)|eukprot:CAMPEP_0168761050 /NCGR_PEP_ID=MMETSP0724-20121128/23093_1 /TAXON_ID=265536 /ORGANISM="Amphiprora sp., Strain CCMP467" /LENGTH=238 /DNA_ID=CAMNT_0008810101 /DNA_START=336 /DNA_END=1052 /DNA_ORIENTATION=+